MATLSLALSACNAPPREFDLEALSSRGGRAELASFVWGEHEPLLEPELAGMRVAIVEFAVEFVETKMEAPTESQLAVTPPLPLFLVLDLAGTQRRNIDWGDLRDSLPEALLEQTHAILEERGVELVAPRRVASAPAWRTIETASGRATGFAQRLNLVASDTGRIKALSLETPAGHGLIRGTSSGAGVDSTLEALARELELDAALRVRVRVGVFQKKLSLERGSVIEVVTPERRGSFTARRSIFSPEPVIDEESFAAVNGASYTLEERRALDAARAMYGPFLRLILEPPEEADEP